MQMIVRVSQVLKGLVGYSEHEKRIGNLRDHARMPAWETLLAEYFDNVIVYGFDKFFAEIFFPDRVPVCLKTWKKKLNHKLGEKAVQRCLMRFVRGICKVYFLVPGEDGKLGIFPIFVDWMHENIEGCFTKI